MLKGQMVPGYVEWCKNCDFFSRIYVFGMLGPRGPLGVGKNPSTICMIIVIIIIELISMITMLNTNTYHPAFADKSEGGRGGGCGALGAGAVEGGGSA